MIGADFEKIEFVLFGLNLVEPMGIITDFIMGGLSVYFGMRIRKLGNNHPFYQYWFGFFFVFGIGAILGGLGHGFFKYWDWPGKLPTWTCGIISVYFLEQAMISIHPVKKWFRRLKIISFWKVVLLTVLFIVNLCVNDIDAKPSLGFLPIAINTILSVLAAAGLLGYYYFRKKLSPIYKYFVLGVLIMIPSAFVFLLKINLHQWFDKNDLSHVLMTLGITYFFLGVIKLSRAEFHKDAYL